MKVPRWLLLLGCAGIAAALAWALWPRARTQGAAPAAATSPSPPHSGVVESALREAVSQSGAPGSTPALEDAGVPEGVVEVRVLAQGKPRSGARVRLYLRGRADPNTGQIDWRLAGAADSAAGGIARIAAGPGTYLVAARWGTFAPARVELQKPSGERTTRVSVELRQPISISGRTVQKGAQEPVPLALVTLTWEASRRPDAPAEEQARATSDALGRFRIDGLEPGRYRAAAQATGYARGALRIDASASREVTLELAQASFIEGRVAAADGSPAAGADVFATGDETVSGVASETGAFSLEVAPRSWALSARRGDEAGRAEAPVAVAAGATARGVSIRLGPAAGLSGAVVAAASGRGIAGAQVAVSPHRSSGDSGRAESGAEGAFLVRGLAPGSYDVEVSAAGYVDASRRGVTVREGQRFPLRVELRATGALEGVVRDAAGRPVAFALVRGGAAEARADDSGAYRLSGVPPGRGSFTALRDGSALGTAAAADVPEGGAARLDFTLADEGAITGLVRRKDGSPPPGDAAVSLAPAGDRRMGGPEFTTVPIDGSGAYAASLPAGAYVIGLSGPRFGGGFRSRSFVTIEAGKTAVKDLAWIDAVEDARGFSGAVLEPDGSPSPGATVRAAGRGLFLAETADEQGLFHLDRPRADLPDTFDLLAFNGGRSGQASVAPGQAEATVRLQPAATLRGHLSGGGAEGFRVDVRTAQPGPPRGGQSLEFSGDRFEIRDVPGQPVKVTVTTQDGRSASLEVPLSPGAVQEVEIPLQPLATVTGRLLDAAAQAPLPDVPLTLDHHREDAPSGADGRFLLRPPGGSHALRAFVPGYRGLSKDFSVQPGEALDLGDVVLERMAAAPGTIGISLRGDSDTPPTVISIIPGGPADRAGVRLGDQVAAVDGSPVTGVPQATARIKGAPGTTVVLAISRGGSTLTFAVTRAP